MGCFLDRPALAEFDKIADRRIRISAHANNSIADRL